MIISWLDPEPANVSAVSLFSKQADVYYEVRNIEGNNQSLFRFFMVKYLCNLKTSGLPNYLNIFRKLFLADLLSGTRFFTKPLPQYSWHGIFLV